MIAVGDGFTGEGFRWGSSSAPWFETVVIMLVIAAMAAARVLVFIIGQRRRDRRPKPVADQWRALAVMGELCPHGWRAQIGLYGGDAPVPADAPASREPLVALEWKQYAEESEQVVVARRVWAPTIGQALQAMVDDRRTDITLERIERAAGEGGELPRSS